MYFFLAAGIFGATNGQSTAAKHSSLGDGESHGVEELLEGLLGHVVIVGAELFGHDALQDRREQVDVLALVLAARLGEHRTSGDRQSHVE